MKKIQPSGAIPTKDALQKSEQAYRTLVETSHDLIWSMDGSGRLTFVNAAARRIFGYEPSEMIGHLFTEFQTPEQAQKDLATFARIMAGESFFNFETVALRKGGPPVWLNINAVVLRNAQANVIGSTGSAQDITGRKQTEAALSLSESHFRLLYENSPYCIHEIDREGRVMLMNRAGLNMMGVKDESAICGMPYLTAVGNEDRERIGRQLQLAFQGQASEFEFKASNGLVFQSSFVPIRDAQGAVARLMGLTQDITERKRSEEALLAGEVLLRQFVKHTPAAVAMLDLEMRYLQASDRWLTDYRLQDREIIGESHYVVFPDIPERWKAVHRRVLAGAVESCEEDPFPRADGTTEWLQWEARPWHKAGGQIGGLIFFTQVITERKQAEQALSQSLSLMLATLESTADGILVVNSDGKISTYNRTFARMWRLPDEVLATKDDSRTLQCVLDQLGDPQKFIEKVRYLYAHPLEESFDSLTFRDGRVFERYSRPQLIAGQVVGRVWSFRDVTERKQLEEHLRQTQKMEAIGQLSGGVSHDLNNLLTVIKGHIGLLRTKGQISPEAVDSVQQIDEAADRAANLTRQLLTFSRQQVMQPIVLNLNGVVVNLTRMLRRLLSESIKMEVECVGQSLPIRADESMVEQVLLNLVVNARDALRKTGTLRITTESVDLDQPAARSLMHARPGAFVCLAVSDTGTGIAPEVLPHIFEPFFTTKGVGKGTGLGLATVYGIMHQHEGWVNVESVVGQGTTFRAYFPRLATAVPDTPVDQGGPPMRGGHEGILLVEDESAVRLVAEVALADLGYRVFSASSGPAGLQVWEAHRHEIELLLTDMVMPGGITGRDLALRLRASAPRLPVIYMSGYNREMAGGDFALEEGTNFLTKPFELAGLARLVRASLDRGASNPPFANRSV